MRFHRFVVWAATLVVVACGPAIPMIQAQQPQRPVGIVSIAPLDRLLQDTTYLLRAVNVPEVGGLVSLMANQYTQGLDRSQPIGVFVSLDGEMPSATIFMPMTSREQFFGALAGMGIEPDDLGGGLFEIDASGQSIFAKQVGGWMHVAQTEQALANVPADPAQLLGALPKQYNVAVSLDVQAVPAELRQIPIDSMRQGLERSLAEQRGLSPEEKQRAEQLSQANVQQLEQLITDTDKIIVGWNVEPSKQQVYIDVAAQFIAGSKLANSMAVMQDLKTDFSQLPLPDAAIKFNFSSKIAEEEKATQILNLRNSFTQMEQLAPAADKQLVKELSAGLFKVLEQTIQEGTFDGAGSVSVADDTFRALIGGRVADGRALEVELKRIAEGISGKPKAPTFKFGVGQYKGMTLHQVTVPVDSSDRNAQKILGDSMKVSIATGDKSFIVAIDPTGEAALKAAIDRVEVAQGQPAAPLNASIQVAQLLKFAESIAPNPQLDLALQTIQEFIGKDHVNVSARVIERGAMYRITVEEGVLRAAGSAAKGGGRNGGF
jgi:hypothetical protein